MTKFDRFAHNMAEANDILTGLSGPPCPVRPGRVRLRLGRPVPGFGRPVEANLGHIRTREGMALTKKNGKPKGKQPKLPDPAQRSIRRYAGGEVSLADLAVSGGPSGTA
ncbi:hypothetical protein [Nonomuraea sp. WAC 01424]|uniref:hypothetical protein n=1 Tax=Nonomuraea sp. WAC 01424 TaxID=2203200 RepID=UPI001C8B56A8|nr:hypothetical protein [Nonomuraea sp. WAC 01424]